MPRAIWKGNITFGPVNVPVKLYSSTENTRIRSHMLHDQDKTRLQQKMVCRQEEIIVERDEMVKGYQVHPGVYVVVDPDELEDLNPQASRDIEVEEFVTLREIDPRYLDRVYYLGSDSSDQIYVNLAAALKKSKTAGICRWTMRKKSYLGILQNVDDVLYLTTHRFNNEVSGTGEYDISQTKTSKKEKDIAKNLIAELTEPFKPAEYHDEYQTELKKLVQSKARGEEMELPKAKKKKATKETDLSAILEKSLSSLKKGKNK
ncbi:MAG: Ku protein [Spirochaetia bacterium]